MGPTTAFVLALCAAAVTPSLTLPSGPTLSVQPEQDATVAFGRAAAKHRYELRELMMTRGIPPDRFSDERTSLAETLSALRLVRDAKLLFFDFEDGLLRSWLLGDGGIEHYRSSAATSRSIDEAVAAVRSSLSLPHLRSRGLLASDVVRPASASDIERSWELLLPGGLRSRLRGASFVAIVPALGIGTVPFTAAPLGDGSLLVDHAAVVVAPSLFELVRDTLQPTRAATHRFDRPLVVGNPSAAAGFPPLPGAEREARLVGATLRSGVLIGTQASRGEVLSRIEDSTLLYFATHGIADAQNPIDGSYLKLSDGVLTAREIQGLPLVADLAVLSACETGVGQALQAGTIGLARGFQIAGVRNVVMSLWKVDNEASAMLMDHFMSALKADGGATQHVVADALRVATLRLKSERYPSSSWAAFTVFGTLTAR
jgi:hypothetical protein